MMLGAPSVINNLSESQRREPYWPPSSLSNILETGESFEISQWFTFYSTPNWNSKQEHRTEWNNYRDEDCHDYVIKSLSSVYSIKADEVTPVIFNIIIWNIMSNAALYLRLTIFYFSSLNILISGFAADSALFDPRYGKVTQIYSILNFI
jgi:hypothetical protein